MFSRHPSYFAPLTESTQSQLRHAGTDDVRIYDVNPNGGDAAVIRNSSGEDAFLGMYNSQMDVESRIDLVGERLEEDVDIDYGGWLKDQPDDVHLAVDDADPSFQA